MGVFTHELRNVIERTKGEIGLDKYPIFDESHRSVLNQKITEHYYMQEIGQEAIPMFVFFLNRRMNEIMPAYNELYKSQLLTFNPLVTIDMQTINDAEAEQTASNLANSTSVSDSEAGGKVTALDTPQTQLSEDEFYATSATKSENDAKTTATANESANTESASSDHSTASVKGYQGSPSQLLMEFRATIMNIDMMIVEDLQDLFMSVWNTGDTYYREGYYA